MRVGNISGTAWKLNIGKTLHAPQQEPLFAPSQEESCGVLRRTGKETVVTSACASGFSRKLGVYALLKAVQDLASRNASPEGTEILLLLPVTAEEEFIKAVMESAADACAVMGVQILRANAEVQPVVHEPVVYVTVVGSGEKGAFQNCSMAGPGQEIVLLGTAGLEGILRILDEREEELSGRFVPAFLQQTKQLGKNLYVLPQIRLAQKIGVTAMQQIGSGGIFAALWELTESSGVGMEIEMARIAMQQETIEICEFYRLNPYQMTSTGSVLMTTECADELIAGLKAVGARAGKLGVTTDKPAKVILGQSEKRYLDRPGPDEFMVWKERCLLKQ